MSPTLKFEFPDFKLEVDGELTKELWERIKRVIEVWLEETVE